MQEVLDQLSRFDLSGKARACLSFLDNVDPCFLGLIVTALVLLGSRMVGGRSNVRGWGLRLAAATFLLYGGYKCYAAGVDGYSKKALEIGLRAVCVSGGVLAFTWIVVPIVVFVLRHLRVALAAFLVYGGYLGVTKSAVLEEQWPFLLLQAALASALALLVVWITEPFWTYAANNWLPRRKTLRGATLIDEEFSEHVRADVARPLTLDPRPRRRTTMLAAPREVLADPYESSSDASRARDAQRRREKARLQLELTYVQTMPAISRWFPRTMLEDFVRRYLNDQLPPEDVEEHARQLCSTLSEHQRQSNAPPELHSMEELTNWLLAEQQRIQQQEGDLALKNGQMLELHQRYLALATRFVHPIAPAIAHQ